MNENKAGDKGKIEGESKTRLEVDFRYSRKEQGDEAPLSYGSLWFENGEDFATAAKWGGVLIHDFLRAAIAGYLDEIQEEMGRKTVGDGTRKKGRLIQHETDYFYDCTCGGKPEYVGSEWKWRCPECGATNYEVQEESEGEGD